jgi:hypothetical protein
MNDFFVKIPKFYIWENLPPHGLSLGTSRQGVFSFSPSMNRRGGAPSGAADYIVSGGMGVSTPIIIPEIDIFYVKPSR